MTTLNYAQALDRARAWFADLARAGGVVVKPITVREALTDYVAHYVAEGGKAEKEMWTKINAHILPTFGDTEVAKLTAASVTKWRDKIGSSGARIRTRTADEQNVRAIPKAKDVGEAESAFKARQANALRARRASANRVLTVLKAALNMAFRSERVASDSAWRRVKPFKKADAPKVQYLADAEAEALRLACGPALRRLVSAALLTGCDYSELTTARVSAFRPQSRELLVAGKRGSRSVKLSDEALAFFAAETSGKDKDASLFVRDDGETWGKSHQSRPFAKAVEAAGIERPADEPTITFHILRHTYAVRMLRRGMPIHQVSAQLGHRSIVTTEKHYAHVIPSDVAEAVQKLSGELGVMVPPAPGPEAGGAEDGA